MPSLTELNQAYIKAKHEADMEAQNQKPPVVSPEQFKAMSLREQNMLYLQYPEVCRECWKELRGDDL